MGLSSFRALFLYAVLSFVTSMASASVLYRGKLSDTGGTPLVGSYNVVVLVKTEGATCTAYSETHSSVSFTAGSFKLYVGAGSVSAGSPSLEKAMDPTYLQTAATDGLSGGCSGLQNNNKYLYLYIDTSPGPVITFNAIPFAATPRAMSAARAEKVGDFSSANLVRVTNAGVPSAIAAITSTDYTKLTDLIAGTSTTYEKSGKLAGGLLTTPSAGQDGQSVKWDITANAGAGGWVYYTPSAGGGVTSFNSRTGAVTPATNDYTWAQIDKSSSSIADLATRSAGDLNSGTLADARLSGNVLLKSGSIPMAGDLNLGGNKLVGDNTSGGNLILDSTSDSTKGVVQIQTSGGNVGIGTAAPNSKLEVAYAPTDTTTDVYGFTSTSGMTAAGSNYTNYAVIGNSLYTATGNASSGILTGVYGLGANFSASASTVGTVIGVEGKSQNAGTSSVVTNAFGMKSSVSKPSGTITNAVGYYAGTIQGTNKWSFYASDATAPSYFSGKVGIGTSAPSVLLTVSGDASVIGKLGIGTTAPNTTFDLSVPAGGNSATISLLDLDVVHGMTSITNSTNEFFSVTSSSTNFGGALINGYSSSPNTAGTTIQGIIGNASPTPGVGAVQFTGAKKSGTVLQSLGASDTLLRVANGGTAVFSILGSGYVGIGTINPSTPLEVKGSGVTASFDTSTSNATVTMNNSTSTGPSLMLTSGGSDALMWSGIYNNLRIAASTSSKRLYLGNSGNQPSDVVSDGGLVLGEYNVSSRLLTNALTECPGGGNWCLNTVAKSSVILTATDMTANASVKCIRAGTAGQILIIVNTTAYNLSLLPGYTCGTAGYVYSPIEASGTMTTTGPGTFTLITDGAKWYLTSYQP